MSLLDFWESLNIITVSRYVESIALHIETAELILDDSELILLFIQLQQVIQNRDYLYLYMWK